ncbi:cob(I)yrinic acid a,c-diamide adenosyltransferase [Reichenbachiella sp. MALMAid0571]|uniref:cob(I)yrinic acid a,c-diamide adenosyltransferase n=1 Tax=Reichenbachiella sp. MALMAid0571 TaxID=3143939 RepID=UPI0032DE4998
MKIYTKTGDKGTTGLLGGSRVSKGHLRIETYGTVDELNSYIGLLRDQEVLVLKSEELIEIQNNLFVIGSSLASEATKAKVNIPKLNEYSVSELERAIDSMDEELPVMKHFVLPGGNHSVSFCHIARCVCRRAERLVVTLSESDTVDVLVIKYLNRLSDYLFTLSRWMAKRLGVEETPWMPSK